MSVFIDTPKLAPPGAGLPKPELIIARLRFRWLRRRLDREAIRGLLQEEAAKVLRLVKECPVADRATPVLINRVRGLEDSSRNWSVYMTLDHLQIVQSGIAYIVRFLADEDKEALLPVSTAEVKPSPNAGEASVNAFKESVAAVQEAVSKIPNLNTKLKHAHPWFGPLDVAAWHALVPMHLSIHRVQLGRILVGLR